MKRETKAVWDWFTTGILRPARIEAEITARCNLDCRFCWIQDPPQFRRDNLDHEMSSERWMKLAEETATVGVEHWRIGGGGEPMVRAEVTVPLMLAIKQRGMSGHLTTNGTIFPESAVAKVVESGWDTIEFSVDGPDAELHDYLRGRSGAFEKTRSVIRLFNKYKELLRSKKPMLIASTVLVRDNLMRMPDMMHFARKEGLEKISINPMTVMVREEEKRQVVWNMKVDADLTQLRDEWLSRAKSTADSLSIDTNVDHFIGNRLIEETNSMHNQMLHAPGNRILEIPCYSPWYMLSIRPHGTSGACCRFKDTEAHNLTEQSFQEVWLSSAISKVRSELSEGRIAPYCSGCSPNNIRFEGEIREELRKLIADRGGCERHR